MNSLDASLLNNYQQRFPLEPRPFDVVGRELGTDAATVLNKLGDLRSKGAISRVGPVFRPNRVGVSTLAALSAPPASLEKVAAIVSAQPEVNHNYEREHELNLWFVVTAPDAAALKQAIRKIERLTGCSVLELPMIKDYHIDLGFHMAHLDKGPAFSARKLNDRHSADASFKQRELNFSRDLVAAIQDGLPLVERPYAEVGRSLGLSEAEVIERLRRLIDSGDIKRFGVVVRHHEFGYRANAMVVWDVPDEQLDDVGAKLGKLECVTLCYQRPRVLPRWRYNLFCMIHGQDRKKVLQCLEQAIEQLGLQHLGHDVLFSGRRFKQRGARYRAH